MAIESFVSLVVKCKCGQPIDRVMLNVNFPDVHVCVERDIAEKVEHDGIVFTGYVDRCNKCTEQESK